MISGINNIRQSEFSPQNSQRQSSSADLPEASSFFEIEDKAIISSQAMLQNELEKFNAGEGDPLDLAMASVIAQVTVSAEVNVINAKKNMMDDIMEIGK